MFFTSWLAGIIAFVFYALIPVIGAVIVRGSWHSFRSRLSAANALPLADPPSVLGPNARAGIPYQVYAVIDAMGEQDRLWIRSGSMTLIVEMRGTPVFIVSGVSSNADKSGGDAHPGLSPSSAFPSVSPQGIPSAIPTGEEDSVEKVRWSAVPSLAQGTGIYVAGMLEIQDGVPCLRNDPALSLLVLLHDIPEPELVQRAMAAGRHRNEYWNPLTQVSLALGILLVSGVLTGMFSMRAISLVMALTLTAAFSPVLPLLPPGVAFFMVYRRYWRLARAYRAMRDVAILQGLAGVGPLRRSARAALALSVASFALALSINAWLVFWLLRLTV